MLEKFLAPGKDINIFDERIIHEAARLTKRCTPRELALEIQFRFVRDQIIYDPVLEDQVMNAAAALVFRRGNSAGKACVLASFYRLAGIPAGISIQIIQDLKVADINTGQPLRRCHAVTNAYLGDRWIKQDVTFDRWFMLARHCFAPCFSITNDAIMPEKDWHGNDNFRIIEESPLFAELPAEWFIKLPVKECS